MSNKQTAGVSIFLVIALTDLLFCLGLFGDTIANVLLPITLALLKWSSIILVYSFCIFIPFRINSLINKRKEIIKEQKVEEKLQKTTEENNELIRKIEQQYYDTEDIA